MPYDRQRLHLECHADCCDSGRRTEDSGRGEAYQDWTRNDDGHQRARLKDLGEEDSPYWNPLGMDMAQDLDHECGSIVRLKYGPYWKTTGLDARLGNSDWYIVWG